MLAGTAHDKLSDLEKRVKSLEAGLQETRKKAAVIVVIATLLGSGGAAGLIQVWTNGRLQRAEAALQERRAEEQDIKTRIEKIDLASKERDQEMKKQIDNVATPATILKSWKESDTRFSEALNTAIKSGWPVVELQKARRRVYDIMIVQIVGRSEVKISESIYQRGLLRQR